MRILQVISSGGFYGAESVLVTLADGLQRLGCTSKVAVFGDSRDPHTELVDASSAKGIECAVVSCGGRFDTSAVRRLGQLIKDFDIDVVHAHGYKTDLYSLAASWSRRPLLFSTCHSWGDPRFSMRMYAKFDRAALRFFDYVTAPSPTIVSTLLGSGVRADRVSYIRNGIDVDRFSQAEPVLRREGGLGTGPLIGFVGRLTGIKGGDVLIRAARRILAGFPDAQFVFAGEGPLLGAWSTLAATEGVAEHCRFLGTRTDMPSVYASFDVMVLPSQIEAMPMCLLEAMAAGIPVIATPVGAVPEVVTPDETGLLVPVGDSGALAQAVNRILGDRDFARGLGQRAHDRIVRGYSSETMARQYLALYEAAGQTRPRAVTSGGKAAARKQTAST